MKLFAVGSLLSGLLLSWLFSGAGAAASSGIDLARAGIVLFIAGIVLLALRRGRGETFKEVVAAEVPQNRRLTRDGKFKIMVADQ